MGTPRNTPAKFWARVDTSGGPSSCWPWTGCPNGNGYGRLWWHGELVLAHRLAYFLEKGRWPAEQGCHTCDSPACCNPAHMFEGTNEDNMDDMDKKGRRFRKIALADVPYIRSIVGRTHKSIAEDFFVDPSTIGLIRRYKSPK